MKKKPAAILLLIASLATATEADEILVYEHSFNSRLIFMKKEELEKGLRKSKLGIPHA